jgi:hypothetical protein
VPGENPTASVLDAHYYKGINGNRVPSHTRCQSSMTGDKEWRTAPTVIKACFRWCRVRGLTVLGKNQPRSPVWTIRRRVNLTSIVFSSDAEFLDVSWSKGDDDILSIDTCALVIVDETHVTRERFLAFWLPSFSWGSWPGPCDRRNMPLRNGIGFVVISDY